jgi:hypothetical protein
LRLEASGFRLQGSGARGYEIGDMGQGIGDFKKDYGWRGFKLGLERIQSWVGA